MKLLITILCFKCLLYSVSTVPPPRTINQWWKHLEIYDINVWTFKDDNADGIGDLKGITYRLSHLNDLGVGVVKFSSIFSSLDRVGHENGIHDYKQIHRNLGTLSDFDALIETAYSRGIEVIMDFPINHISRYHEWFEKSRQRIDPYTDYFIWKGPPDAHNDNYVLKNGVWILDDDQAEENTNGWEWDSVRNELFYLFNDSTPHLNFRNEYLIKEIEDILTFWFDRGVVGVNLMSVHDYMEDPIENNVQRPFLQLFNKIRHFINRYNQDNGGHERIFMVDKSNNKGTNDKQLLDLHGTEDKWSMAHIVTDHIFITYPNEDIAEKRTNYYDAKFLDGLVKYITKNVKTGSTLFIAEDGEGLRLATRFKDRQFLDVWITFLYMCPGLLHVYYGQEIGLSNWKSPDKKSIGFYPYGSAMAWDDSLYAGFTAAEVSSILPNGDYWKVNVEAFKNAKFSTYHLAQDLLQLRRTINPLTDGGLYTYILSEGVYVFTRKTDNNEYYVTILNPKNVASVIFIHEFLEKYTDKVRVVAATPNSKNQKGEEINTYGSWTLRPMSGMIFVIDEEDVKFVPED